MTFIWLIVWVFSGTPDVQIFVDWNTWGVGLAVCAFIDLTGALSARAWRPYSHGGDRTWQPASALTKDQTAS